MTGSKTWEHAASKLLTRLNTDAHNHQILAVPGLGLPIAWRKLGATAPVSFAGKGVLPIIEQGHLPIGKKPRVR